MRDTDNSPEESSKSASERPKLKSTSASPIWDVPGDVPAARPLAQAEPVDPELEAREGPPTPEVDADSQSGAYDQRNVHPVILKQVLSTPLERPPLHPPHRPKRALGPKARLPGLAALLVVAALLGVYAIQHTRTGVASTVAASGADLPTTTQTETPMVADPREVLETPSVAVVPGVRQVVPVSASMHKPAASPRVIEHVVKKGDTLWDLAEQYTQDPFRYPELARQSHIQVPDLIYPGQIIRIEPAT